MARNLLYVRLHGSSSTMRAERPIPVPDIGRRGPGVRTMSARVPIAAPVLVLIFVLVPAISSAQWTQLGPDIDGEAAGDSSGYSVALSSDGTRLAVGARDNDNANGVGSGHVRVFEWDPALEGWSQLGDDVDGEAEQDHSGYSVALSSSGSRVAIGAPGNDDAGNFAGHVRVFEWDGGSSWIQLGSDINGDASYDNLGGSVDLSSDGSRLAVGALGNDGNGSESGVVRVFVWDGRFSNWVQLGQDIRGEAEGDWSGSSVALSSDGSRVAIGAPENDGNGTGSGHARVYEWVPGTSLWAQLGQDIDGEGNNDHSSIVALSLDGTRLAVGAWSNDGAGTEAGHVRVHEWDSGSSTWIQVGSDIDGEAAYDHSGTSVALSSGGSRLAVGAPGNDNVNGDASGHARVYCWDGGSWVQLGPDIDGEAAGDLSGASLALCSNGSRLAVGAFYNDNANGDDSGHVRVFSEAIFSDGFETGGADRWSSVSP